MAEHSSRTTNSLGPRCDRAYDSPPAIRVSTTFAEYGVTVAMSDKAELLERVELYAHRNGTRIISTVEFGHGLEGSVWVSQRDSAIKIIRNRKNYGDELEAYRRLQAKGVRQLCGFAIPWLLGSDDELQAIEMEIVQKPYLLDFGKV
jgi:hypothetical protein